MRPLIFGIPGAVAAVLYWRYFFFDGSSLPVGWVTPDRGVFMFAAGGFVVGCVIGFVWTIIRSAKH